jgi:hypothetical protein
MKEQLEKAALVMARSCLAGYVTDYQQVTYLTFSGQIRKLAQQWSSFLFLCHPAKYLQNIMSFKEADSYAY